MNRKLVTSLFVGILAVFSCSVFAQNTATLAERHVQNGQNCAACHSENPPAQAVPTEKCQSCHGEFEAMKEKTKDCKPNPHYTHMGDQPCEECHKGHQPSVNMCAQCHKIELNVK